MAGERGGDREMGEEHGRNSTHEEKHLACKEACLLTWLGSYLYCTHPLDSILPSGFVHTAAHN